MSSDLSGWNHTSGLSSVLFGFQPHKCAGGALSCHVSRPGSRSSRSCASRFCVYPVPTLQKG